MHHCLLAWRKVICISPMFYSLLDSISTYHSHNWGKFPLRARASTFGIHTGILESEILNSNGSKTNTRVCMDIWSLFTDIVANSICFQGIYEQNLVLWAASPPAICSELLTVQKGPWIRNRMWKDCTQADSLHNILTLFWNYRSPIFSNSILDFQDFMKIYLSRQKDRIYFISQSVNWIF